MTFMHMTARKFAASLFIFAIAVSIDHEASADDHGGKPQPYEYAVASDMASEALLLDVASAGSRLVAVGEFGHVLLSDDKGTSWRQAASVPTRNTLVGVTFLDNQTGYAVGHAATILKQKMAVIIGRCSTTNVTAKHRSLLYILPMPKMVLQWVVFPTHLKQKTEAKHGHSGIWLKTAMTISI